MGPPHLDLKSLDWYYRGEGNKNLVIALREKNKIIRISKIERNTQSKPSNTQQYMKFMEYLKPFLGKYMDSPQVAYLDEANAEYLEQELKNQRPEARLTKKIQYGEVLIYNDYTLLSNSVDDVFCIEIKLKQGWTPECDRKQLCVYCSRQFYKLEKGEISELNRYCPIDLYSGDWSLMMKALKALLENPQNNLKIYKNGITIFSNESPDLVILLNELQNVTNSYNDLCGIIIQILLGVKPGRIDTEPKSTGCYNKLKENPELPEGCVLDILYKIQRLNKLGIRETLALYDQHLRGQPDSSKLNIVSLREQRMDNNVRDNLIGYLMFSTFRDCSAMLTFRLNNSGTTSKNSIVLDNGCVLETDIHLIDLDLKPLSTIEKHLKNSTDSDIALKSYKENLL